MERNIIIDRLTDFATIKKEIEGLKENSGDKEGIQFNIVDAETYLLGDANRPDEKLNEGCIEALIKIVKIRGKLIDKIRKGKIISKR